MTNISDDIKYNKEELEKAIEDGVKLFIYYKELSKEFMEEQKILMNNTELKKELDNLKKNYEEEVKITKAQRNATSSQEMKELPNNVKEKQFAKAEKKLKILKNRYDKELNFIKKKSEISEQYIVNIDKKFLKKKEEIRKIKKRILTRIRLALSTLKKKMFVPEFKEFIKYIHNESYNTVDGKEITFKKLMNHLESGEITEEAAKKTKKINELKTINNIDYRKSEIEYEINKLKKNKKKNSIKKKLKKKL